MRVYKFCKAVSSTFSTVRSGIGQRSTANGWSISNIDIYTHSGIVIRYILYENIIMRMGSETKTSNHCHRRMDYTIVDRRERERNRFLVLRQIPLRYWGPGYMCGVYYIKGFDLSKAIRQYTAHKHTERDIVYLWEPIYSTHTFTHTQTHTHKVGSILPVLTFFGVRRNFSPRPQKHTEHERTHEHT